MEIQPADVAERRRVIGIVVSAAFVLIALAFAFEFWLRHLSIELDGAGLLATLKPVLRACLLLIAACGIGLGAHLIVRGNTIVRERRFPASDTRVIRATPVRKEAQALRIGRRCQTAGAVLCLAGCAFALLAMLWVNAIV